MDNILEIFLLTIGASFVQRTTGFGFGIFIMTRIQETSLRRILGIVLILISLYFAFFSGIIILTTA